MHFDWLPHPANFVSFFLMTHTVQYFMLIYCSVRDHPLKHSEPARSTPLIQTNSPSFRSHQLSIAPQLHGDARESLLLPSLNLTGLISWRSCAEKQSCHKLMSVVVLSCPDGTVLLQSSWPLPSMAPEPWWKEVIMYVPFAAEQSTNRCFLH